jgi:hypothetical protein
VAELVSLVPFSEMMWPCSLKVIKWLYVSKSMQKNNCLWLLATVKISICLNRKWLYNPSVL